MGSVRDSVRSRCRDEQRRDAVPAPSAPPGGAQGARARNGAEMATAGLTDSAAPRAPPAPGTARDSPGCWPPRARRSRSAAGGHGSSAGPNGPAAASTPATGAGLPAPEAGTARPRSLPSHPHPRTQHPRSHLCPTCSAWRVAKERGAAEQRPPRGKGHRPRFLTPGPAERAAGKWPTLHAPVLGARFPQWQLRCPSRCHLVPASPQTNAARGRPAATANRACACGRGREEAAAAARAARTCSEGATAVEGGAPPPAASAPLGSGVARGDFLVLVPRSPSRRAPAGSANSGVLPPVARLIGS